MNILKSGIKILSLVFVIQFFTNFCFAEVNSSMSCQTMLSGFSNLNSNSFNNIKEMTKYFCEKSSTLECMDDGDFFSANQSVFLSTLCDNVGVGGNFTSVIRTGDDAIIKKNTFESFGIYQFNSPGDINYCDHKTNVMNGCDLYLHLPKIFNETLNDYFNVGQARVYGISVLEDVFDPTISANKFSSGNFAGLEICGSSKKNYEISCKYLKNYMKNARNLLTNTKILDVKKMTELNKDVNCDNDFSKNMLYCGLLGGGNDYTQVFINVIYNEYMWYRIFMSYYASNLSQNTKISSLITTSDLEKMSDNKEKAFSIQQQTFKIKQSLSMSLRSLSEISGSFPMHIGFTMYQEDANIFMKELVKIYPPIRTLFDKLRNVQKSK